MCCIAAFEHTKQRLLIQLIHDLSYLKAYNLLGFLYTFPFWITAQLSPKVWSMDPLKSYQGALLSKKRNIILLNIFHILWNPFSCNNSTKWCRVYSVEHKAFSFSFYCVHFIGISARQIIVFGINFYIGLTKLSRFWNCLFHAF